MCPPSASVAPITCPCRSPPPASAIDMTTGQWFRPSVLPWVPIMRRAAELAHGDHQHVVEQAPLLQVARPAW